MKTKILSIIVTYNSLETDLKNIFDSLKNQTDIMFVDNSSPEFNFQFLLPGNFILIKNNENLGVAKAFNLGIKYAIKNKYDFCLLLDDDSLPDEKMIEYLLDGIKIDKNILISCPALIDKNSYKRELMDDFVFVNWAISSGSLINLGLIENVGYYDESLFIDYVDAEYALRLRSKGFRIIRSSKAYLYHKLGNIKVHKIFWFTVFSTNHSYIRQYYKMRNRVYVWRKYFFNFPLFVIKQFLRVFLDIMIILFFELDSKRKLKYIFLGFLDGVKLHMGRLEYEN